MKFVTIQAAGPRRAVLAADLAPVTAHAAEIPLRFHCDWRTGARSIIRQWRLRKKCLHDTLRRCRGDIRFQEGVIVMLSFNKCLLVVGFLRWLLLRVFCGSGARWFCWCRRCPLRRGYRGGLFLLARGFGFGRCGGCGTSS